MSDLVGLVFPFFGLIFLGFLVAKVMKQPLDALGWMNIFIVYVALPALFFQLLSKTPIEKLTEWSFIFGSVAATYIVFTIMFAASFFLSRGEIRESTIKGLASAYGNIGFMGPGLALLAFGEQAAAPVALIFCFENMIHFAVAPMMMAVAAGAKDDAKDGKARLMLDVAKRILLHPFIVATIIGVLAAAFHVKPPLPVDRLLEMLSRAAAPCALFTMGVTLALRPLNRVPTELAPIALLKLIIHPLLAYVILSYVGNFDPVWVWVAVLLAALPTATNVYVIAQQYGVWVQRASASVLITTVLSVGTVSALLYLIRSGALPPDLFP